MKCRWGMMGDDGGWCGQKAITASQVSRSPISIILFLGPNTIFVINFFLDDRKTAVESKNTNISPSEEASRAEAVSPSNSGN